MQNNVKRAELTGAKIFVGLEGVTVDCIDENGEIVFSVGYPAGVHYIDTLRAHMDVTHSLSIQGENFTVLKGSTNRVVARVKPVRHPLASELGANPDYRPSLDEGERAARLLMRKISEKSDALDRRMAAFERAVALRPQTEVVDNEPTQEPAAETVPEAAQTEGAGNEPEV